MAVRSNRKVKNVDVAAIDDNVIEQLASEMGAKTKKTKYRNRPIDRTVERKEKCEETVKMSQSEVSMKKFEDEMMALRDRVMAAYPDYTPDKERLIERSKEVIAEVIMTMLTAPEEERGEDILQEKVIKLLEEEMMVEARKQAEETAAAGAVVVSASASVEQPAEEALQDEASQEDVDASTVTTISTDFEEIVEAIHAQGYRAGEQGTLVGFKEVCVSKESQEFRVVPVFEDAIGLQKADMRPFYLKDGMLVLEESELTKYDYIGNQHLV